MFFKLEFAHRLHELGERPHVLRHRGRVRARQEDLVRRTQDAEEALDVAPEHTSGDVGSPFLCWIAAFILVVVYGSSKWVGEGVLKRSRTLDWVDQNEWTKIGAKIILMNEHQRGPRRK